MRMRAMMAAVIGLGGTIAFSACALREAESPAAAQVERAETAADHAAIAQQYAKEAAELRGKAVMHDVMLRAYEKGPTYQKVRHNVRRKAFAAAMVKHCRNLIHYYTQAAAEAEAMAQDHRELAAKESQ